MSRPSRTGWFALLTHLIENVESDRIEQVLHDDSEYGVRSALGFASTGYLILPSDRDLVVRVL